MIRSRRWVVLVVLWSTVAVAFEEGARREEVDAGVLVPVLTRPPALIRSVSAAFPEQAKAEGRAGDVKLLLTVGADGSVTEAAVTEPVGAGFDEAAVEAVKQFRFTPAEVDGVPAPVQIEYVFHFTLSAPTPVAPAAPAPPATLKGELLARGSRSRIEGATVRCGAEEDAPEALSDEDGRFSLTAEPGVCKVSVVANGFRVFKTTENLASGETTEVIYHVIPKATGYETVVRGEREKKEVVRRTLQREELQKIPGSFGDPVRVLQNFPGVARAPFISGALIVRGANPAQTLTYLDGVEIPLLFHLGGGPSVVNGEFLDHIDFYPGGFGARYGRAVGGAVDVAARHGATDTAHGVLKIDLQDTSIYLETPVGKNVSVAAAVRRSYIDALLPLVLPKDPNGGTLLILPRYWDYQVRVDVGAHRKQLGGNGASSYSLMAFGSDDTLKVVATGGGRNRDVSLNIHTLFHRLVGGWSFREGALTSTLTPYAGYDLGSLSFGSSFNLRADEYELGLREDLSLALAPFFTLRGGVDILFDHIRGLAEIPVLSGTQYVGFPGAEPKTETQRIARTINEFDGAVYAEADLKVGRVTLTPGLRGSYARLHGETRYALEPRLWTRLQLSATSALKGSIGLYQQPPDATDLEPAPFGNPNLVHEKAFQTSLGFEQKFTDAINIDVTGFYNRRFQNVVSPGQTIVNDDGSITAERYSNTGLGRAYGLEVMLRHEVTKNFFGWLAYTFSRAEGKTEGDKDYYLGNFDETHILTLVGSYKLPWNIEVGGRFRYVTGRPTAPLIHERDIYNADSNGFGTTRGLFRSVRLKNFNQLDVRIEKSWLFTSWTFSTYLDVQNVYNAKNVEATFTDYRSRQEYDVPGIPILPILGVKGSF